MTAAIRCVETEELGTARALIASVVAETYGHIIDLNDAMITSEEELADCLVAVVDGEIVGVGLSVADLVDDLWISRRARGRGIGADLLRALELEIAKRGHGRGRLHVVAENTVARRFYKRQGWRENRHFPHEKQGHMMIECVKDLSRSG